MTATTFDRIAVQAQQFKPLRALLTLLAAPFYLVGLLIGFVWIAIAWCYAAALIGVRDVKDRKNGRADGAG